MSLLSASFSVANITHDTRLRTRAQMGMTIPHVFSDLESLSQQQQQSMAVSASAPHLLNASASDAGPCAVASCCVIESDLT